MNHGAAAGGAAGGAAAGGGGAVPLAASLRVGYYNCRSIVGQGKRLELERIVGALSDAGGGLDVLCLQETWLKPNLQFTMAGWEVYRRDRTVKGGGAWRS